MSAPRGLSELVLITTDVGRAAAFYRDVVGLTPLAPASPEWAWFWSGEANASPYFALRRGTLLFEEKSPLAAGQRFGRAHFALRVEREDLDRCLARLRAAGIEVLGPVALDWMNADSVYFYDPDANLVEYWTPRRP
ncbi:MAG: VOC family protein [Phycisphaerales bacterium]|nr:VOC family protein [Phycisphaerales bacterium]